MNWHDSAPPTHLTRVKLRYISIKTYLLTEAQRNQNGVIGLPATQIQTIQIYTSSPAGRASCSLHDVHLFWIIIRLTWLISKYLVDQSGNKVAEQAFEQAFSSVASKNPKQALGRGFEAKHWRIFSVTASLETCLLQIMDTSLRVGDQRSARSSVKSGALCKGDPGTPEVVVMRGKGRGKFLASDMTWAYRWQFSNLCSSGYGNNSRFGFVFRRDPSKQSTIQSSPLGLKCRVVWVSLLTEYRHSAISILACCVLLILIARVLKRHHPKSVM